ncbi:tetratricopeptide repeat protein [Chitinivorax sp. B]|uniref:tetratricopeptide repeat protein n=1 Tax=Chitinivorax sp. B TaxID=2502235 RepID=UPI0010F5F3C6|nr:tetratricopeptide repeat protein [Chitinivorax sp. B]
MMNKRLINQRLARWYLVLSVGLSTSVWAEALPMLDQAEQLLRQGKADQALALLAPAESQRAGEVDYDYLLGAAYLANNQPEAASFALERVVAQSPRHAAAWLDLGRAYLKMGDRSRAKAVFDTIMDMQPPAAARAMVYRQLVALERPAESGPYTLTGYLDTGLGWDSNINTSPSGDLLTVPALGDLQVKLNPQNVQLRDSYGRLTAGGEASVLLAGQLRSVTSVRGNARRFRQHHVFSTDDAELRSGLQLTHGNTLWVVNAVGQWATLGSRLNRRSWGGNLDWWYRLDERNHLLLSGQFMRHQYPAPGLADNNFDQRATSLSWIYSHPGGEWQLASQLFGAKEVSAQDRTDGNATLSGIRMQGSWRGPANTEWYVTAGALQGRYDRVNSAFLVNRADRQWSVGAGAAMRLNKALSLQLKWDYISRNSNIPISDYVRHDVNASVRYDFR